MLKFRKTFLLLIAFGLLLLSGLVLADETSSTHFFRQVVYNHVSPHLPLRGIYEISAETAQKSPHYIFKLNSRKQLVEVINNHPITWKSHPLTHIGADKIVFNYNQSEEVRTFYNRENQPVANIRGVYKEVYAYDANGFKCSLNFYDQNGQPTESNWKIARYIWEKQQGLVIERRYNLNGELAKISPYFDFLITGIKYNDQGLPMAHYNLNEVLEITENYWGVASYQDKYDQNGNHIEYAYYNKANQLTPSAAGFAIGRKTYDLYGNVIKEEYLDKNSQHLRAVTFQYNENGLLNK